MAHAKILFKYDGAAPDEYEVESIWASKCDDGYVIDNIPFYVQEIALGDVVAVQTEADGAMAFAGLVRPSGHSTIQLWFSNERDVSSVREALEQMGCASEGSNLSRLVAVDVPPTVSYEKVKQFLEQGAQALTFEYQEACLGSL